MSPLRLAAVLLPVLFLAQSAHGVRRRLASVPHRNLGWSEPNYTIYHRQDVLLREVEDIVKANPSYMKVSRVPIDRRSARRSTAVPVHCWVGAAAMAN